MAHLDCVTFHRRFDDGGCSSMWQQEAVCRQQEKHDDICVAVLCPAKRIIHLLAGGTEPRQPKVKKVAGRSPAKKFMSDCPESAKIERLFYKIRDARKKNGCIMMNILTRLLGK